MSARHRKVEITFAIWVPVEGDDFAIEATAQAAFDGMVDDVMSPTVGGLDDGAEFTDDPINIRICPDLETAS